MAFSVSEPDMTPEGFEILYEEGPCLVVSKPSGMLTQAPAGIDSLERRVKQFLKLREAKPGRVYLGVPHRLDRPVSGALVLARHVRAARRLCEQFEGRMVRKRYWALVEGRLPEAQGRWEDQIRKIPGEARAEIVDSQHPEGRAAELSFCVLSAGAECSWLEIHLETGRTHQIRVQAASRGHPVLGDQQYGSGVSFGEPAVEPRERSIALHARSLAFRHPMTRTRLEIAAPLPGAWSSADSRLGLPDVGGEKRPRLGASGAGGPSEPCAGV